MLSHDLANSLNAALGFAELLLNGASGPLSAQQQHLVRNIREAAQLQLALLKEVRSRSGAASEPSR